jgi:hypothetical protein
VFKRDPQHPPAALEVRMDISSRLPFTLAYSPASCPSIFLSTKSSAATLCLGTLSPIPAAIFCAGMFDLGRHHQLSL